MKSQNPWREARGRVLALASSKKEWYSIRNAAPGARTQVHIYDDIGFLGKTAHDFIQDLDGIEGPIDLHLNSPGGEVFDGVAIYNTLLARDDVDVYVEGIAASIASVIAMAGDRVFIAPTAQFMVHNAFAMAAGDATDLREMADQLDRNTENIASIYAARTGRSREHWLALMDKESWFTGQEAVDAGLADSVIPIKAVSAKYDMAMPLKKGKMAARASSPSDAAHHPYHGHFDTHHEPMTGTHSHNHAEFGFGDGDDGIHAHPHTHSNDAHHDHTHMSHSHSHGRDEDHDHAHAVGHEHYDTAEHTHTHHDVTGGGDDDTHQSTDHDHDAFAATGPGMGQMCCYRLKMVNGVHAPGVVCNHDKYSVEDRRRMAKSGEALHDGSYPIADSEDLHNAIHAVGRGGDDHGEIRRHIIKRAHALGLSSQLPGDWTSSGATTGHSATTLYNDSDAAAFVSALRG